MERRPDQGTTIQYNIIYYIRYPTHNTRLTGKIRSFEKLLKLKLRVDAHAVICVGRDRARRHSQCRLNDIGNSEESTIGGVDEDAREGKVKSVPTKFTRALRKFNLNRVANKSCQGRVRGWGRGYQRNVNCCLYFRDSRARQILTSAQRQQVGRDAHWRRYSVRNVCGGPRSYHQQ